MSGGAPRAAECAAPRAAECAAYSLSVKAIASALVVALLMAASLAAGDLMSAAWTAPANAGLPVVAIDIGIC